MKVRIVAVGRPRDRTLDALYEDYAARARRLGLEWDSVTVREEAAGGRYSAEHAREREGRALLAARAARGNAIALDGAGGSWSSAALARRLPRWATPCATFLIGGPSGLHPDVPAACDEVWSLSELTLPHELARVVVAEQLYRAMTMLRGVPYHK